MSAKFETFLVYLCVSGLFVAGLMLFAALVRNVPEMLAFLAVVVAIALVAMKVVEA